MARNKMSGKGAEKKVTMKKSAAQKPAPARTSSSVKPPAAKPAPVQASKPAVAQASKAAPKAAPKAEKVEVKKPAPAAKKVVVGAKPAPAAPVPQAAAKAAAPVAAAKVAPKVPAKAPIAPKEQAVPAAVAARPVAASPARAMPTAAKPHGQAIKAPIKAPGAAAQSNNAAAIAAAAAAKAAADKAAAAKKNVNQRHGFKLSEWIVYPAHGVGRIVGIEEQEIAGISLELFVITFEKDKMTLRVPTGKSQSVGMRKLAEENTVKRAMETLKGKARVKRTMWSRRAQEYEAKINSGDLIAIAEVVRDLYRSESQPEQSYSERQLYEAALDRMARELAAVEKLDERGAVQRITEVLSKSAKGRRAAAEEAGEVEAEVEPEGETDTEIKAA